MTKLVTKEELIVARQAARERGQRVVFTNGCFDLIHAGHVSYLRDARALGDLLVVAINSDQSVQRLKGPARPIMQQEERAAVLGALEMVDYVTIFDEETPYEIIAAVVPDILVKGGDWALDQIVGRTEVEAAGGTVYSLPYLPGASTTDIISRILTRHQK